MHDRKNTTIGLLCVTATLLGAALLFLQQTDGVVAATAESRGGDYIWAAARISDSEDAICVIDIDAERMNVYGPDSRNKDIAFPAGGWVDLKNVFDEANAMRGPRR